MANGLRSIFSDRILERVDIEKVEQLCAGSQTLSALIAELARTEGRRVEMHEGAATVTQGGIISVSAALVPGQGASDADYLQFATVLGHELAHAVRPNVPNHEALKAREFRDASNPFEGANIMVAEEGDAAYWEYRVARELNASMYSGGPYADASLQSSLDRLASQLGFDTPEFALMARAAATDYMRTAMSSAGKNLTYSDYYAIQWTKTKCTSGVMDLDMANISSVDVGFTLLDGNQWQIDIRTVDLVEATQTMVRVCGDPNGRIRAEEAHQRDRDGHHSVVLMGDVQLDVSDTLIRIVDDIFNRYTPIVSGDNNTIWLADGADAQFHGNGNRVVGEEGSLVLGFGSFNEILQIEDTMQIIINGSEEYASKEYDYVDQNLNWIGYRPGLDGPDPGKNGGPMDNWPGPNLRKFPPGLLDADLIAALNQSGHHVVLIGQAQLA